jgi:hypothetical protein
MKVPGPPPGQGFVRRKAYKRTAAGAMDMASLEAMLMKNPELGTELMNNPAVPGQVKEMVMKIQAIARARATRLELEKDSMKRKDPKIMKKKLKLVRRRKAKRMLKRLRRRALKFARKLSRIVAYLGCFLFILIAGYFNLIYAIKFTPDVAMSWIVSSVFASLQGWLLVEPFEVCYGATKQEFVDAAGDTYMQEGGGDRQQAAMIKWEQLVKKDKKSMV